MNIAEIIKLKGGETVNTRVVLSDKAVLPKKTSGDFLSLTIQDATGTMTFPIWDDIPLLDGALHTGDIIDIADAVYTTWNDNPQLKNPRFHVLTDEEKESLDYSLFVPSYDIPEELIAWFTGVIEKMADPWKSLALQATGALGTNPARWKEFMACVSGEKHHGNKRGGLFLHTCGVLKSVMSMAENYVLTPLYYDAASIINTDRLYFKAIFHDIKKVDEYEYDTCIRRRKDKPLGHIYDSVSYLREINKELGNVLTSVEEEAIIWSVLAHHGQWGPTTPDNAEDWLLHLADMIDSRIVGELEKQPV